METSSLFCGSTTMASNQNHINSITDCNNCDDCKYLNKRPYHKQMFKVSTGTLWSNIISFNIPTLLIKYIGENYIHMRNRCCWCDIKALQWIHYSMRPYRPLYRPLLHGVIYLLWRQSHQRIWYKPSLSEPSQTIPSPYELPTMQYTTQLLLVKITRICIYN